MKSRQLLSVVLSLVMLFGVSAGSAFAQTDETVDSNSIDVVTVESTAVVESDELRDDTDDAMDETDDERDEDDDRDYRDNYNRDYTKDGKHYDLDDRLANWCNLSDDEKRQFFADHPRFEQFSDRLANYCDLSDYSRDSKIKDFIRIHVTDEDRDSVRDYVKDHVTGEDWDRNTDADFRDKLAQWCEMSDADKEVTAAKYDKTEDQIAKADRYCTLNESDRADFIIEHRDEFKAHMKDKMMDKDIRGMIDRYCEMSDKDKRAFVAEHDKAADHVEKMNEYCELDDDAREDYIKDHMKDKMRDNMTDKKPHMNYDRLCDMAASDRALEITDVAKLDRISEWCEMTPEEREDYKRDHMKDKMMDKYPKKDFNVPVCDMLESDRALAITDPEELDRISKYCAMSADERKDYKMKHPDVMKDKCMIR